MKKTVRKAVIAGNWKMNKTRPEAKALLEELKPMVADVKDVEVVACVPFTNLETALAVTAGTNIKIGAENCHFEKSGNKNCHQRTQYCWRGCSAGRIAM